MNKYYKSCTRVIVNSPSLLKNIMDRHENGQSLQRIINNLSLNIGKNALSRLINKEKNCVDSLANDKK